MPVLDYHDNKVQVRYTTLSGLLDPNYANDEYYIRLGAIQRTIPDDEIYYREFSFISGFMKWPSH